MSTNSLSGSGRGRSTGLNHSESDSSWSILYGALVNQLGVDPGKFQLLYPMTSWNWETTNVGFTSGAQYDFCAAMPQWSATGSYVSSGATFDGCYIQFLNTIMLATSDPDLLRQLKEAQNNLTQASNNLTTVYNQSVVSYSNSVTDNNPDYTTWLGTPGGSGYANQIAALQNQVSIAQAVVNSLANEQETPNIASALKAYSNDDYYTQLVDPGLSKFPKVPNYSIPMTSQEWINQVLGGGGNPGQFTFSNSDSHYDYSKTWAQGSASISYPFWAVCAQGEWSRLNEFSSDSSLSVTISFKAWDTISITPSKWFSGIVALKNGPYKKGFSAFSNPADPSVTYMFGKGGLIPILKTGMLVCLQPKISVNCSTSTYEKFQQEWSAAIGIRVGPFSIGGAGGGTQLNWTKTASGMNLTVDSSSNIPLIFGLNIVTEPQ